MGVGFAPAAWALESSQLLVLDRERSLVSRARDGEQDAFRAVFDHFGKTVHRLVWDLVRDDAAADEVTQETFVRAFARIDSIRDDERLAPWLFGIARNVAFEHLRTRGRSPLRPQEEANEAAGPGTPESSLLGREVESAVQTALGQLSPDRRAALLLRVDHGLPYEQIAESLGWSLSKAKVEVHRARKVLRGLLSPHLEDHRDL